MKSADISNLYFVHIYLLTSVNIYYYECTFEQFEQFEELYFKLHYVDYQKILYLICILSLFTVLI